MPNSSRPWYRYAKKLICEQLLPVNNGWTALDVGCGVGEFMLILRDMGFAVEGIDGSEEQMEIVHSMGLLGRLADLEEGLPYLDDSFSLVTCLELIEHVAEAEVLLKEMYRVLHVGGHLILSTPNFSFLNNRLHYFLGSGPCNEGIHLRFFTKNALESILEKAGFSIVGTNSYGVIPLISTLRTRLLRQEPALWKVPASLESLFAYVFIYLAKKRDRFI
jgi:2-polyprenyl-3-methyl-5-hydroxy-6-metoxy-1,4-benzoquinol methylase